MKDTGKPRLSRLGKVCLIAALALFAFWIALLTAVYLGDVYFLFNWAFVLPFTVGLMLLGVALLSIAKRKLSRSGAKIALRVIAGLVLGAGLLTTGLYAVYAPLLNLGSHKIFASPSGKNRIVVIENGFIDAFYSAYPYLGFGFYLHQDNGAISHHDFWGEVHNANLEWFSDTQARVTIDGIEGFGIQNEGNNPDDQIIVSFD